MVGMERVQARHESKASGQSSDSVKVYETAQRHRQRGTVPSSLLTERQEGQGLSLARISHTLNEKRAAFCGINSFFRKS